MNAWNENISRRALSERSASEFVREFVCEFVSEFVCEFVREFVSEFVLVSHDVALNPAHSLSFLDVEHQQVIFHHVKYVAGQLVHVCKQGTHLE